MCYCKWLCCGTVKAHLVLCQLSWNASSSNQNAWPELSYHLPILTARMDQEISCMGDFVSDWDAKGQRCCEALITWSAGEPFDRHAGRVLGASADGHPADVPRRPGLARLHHRSYWNQWDGVMARLLGAGWLPGQRDLDWMRVGLRRLAVAVREPGAGRRRDNERDVDLLHSGPGGIWQRGGSLWSQGHCVERDEQGHDWNTSVWSWVFNPHLAW